MINALSFHKQATTNHKPQPKKLKIKSDNNSPLNFYIKGVNLNGSKYNNNWLSHSELTKGPKIDFSMQSMPSDWGSDESSVPYSMTNDK